MYPDEQESAEPGWMSGWKGDTAGIFPANYVIKEREVFEPVSTSGAKKALPAVSSTTTEPHPAGMSKM